MRSIWNCCRKFFFALIVFFAKFTAKTRTKRLNKTKNEFEKCVVESHFTSISGLGSYILSNKSKSFYPSLHILIAGTRTRSVMWSLHIYCVIRQGNVVGISCAFASQQEFPFVCPLNIGVWYRYFWKYIILYISDHMCVEDVATWRWILQRGASQNGAYTYQCITYPLCDISDSFFITAPR